MQPRQMLTLPETNIAAENGWLEDEISFQDDLFSAAMLASHFHDDFFDIFYGSRWDQ